MALTQLASNFTQPPKGYIALQVVLRNNTGYVTNSETRKLGTTASTVHIGRVDGLYRYTYTNKDQRRVLALEMVSVCSLDHTRQHEDCSSRNRNTGYRRGCLDFIHIRRINNKGSLLARQFELGDTVAPSTCCCATHPALGTAFWGEGAPGTSFWLFFFSADTCRFMF